MAGLLGGLRGIRALEVGCGAAQGSRYAARPGAVVVGADLSRGMLQQTRELGEACPLVQCDATALPFAEASFDLVFTAYGAVPSVADSAGLIARTPAGSRFRCGLHRRDLWRVRNHLR